MKKMFFSLLCFLFTIMRCHAEPNTPDAAAKTEALRVASLGFSRDGKLLAGVFHRNVGEQVMGMQVRLWSVADGKLRWSRESSLHRDTGVTFSPDGQLLAVYGHVKPTQDNGWLADYPVLLNTTTGKVVRSLELAPDELVSHLAFSPDGTQLVGATGKRQNWGLHSSTKLWDARTGNYLRELGSVSGNSLAFAFSNAGDRLVQSSVFFDNNDHTKERITILAASDYSFVKNFALEPAKIEGFVLSPDASFLVTHHRNPANFTGSSRLVVRSLDTGKVGHTFTLRGLSPQLSSFAITPDGTELVASGTARYPQPASFIKIWNLQDGKERSLTFESPEKPPVPYHFRMALSGDGKQVALAAAANKIELRNLQDGALLRVFE